MIPKHAKKNNRLQMEWISFKKEVPDAKNYKVLVFCTSSIYTDDEEPTVESLHWYKCNFGDNHDDHMKKITHWMPLPNPPSMEN